MGNVQSEGVYETMPVHNHGSIHYTRIGDEESSRRSFQPFLSTETRLTNKLLKTSLNGIWSIQHPNLRCPSPRIGHFSCVNPERTIAYIGYGSDHHNAYSDLWKLDMITLEWTEIRLCGNVLSPRSGCSAVYVDGVAYVFGGYHSPHFYGDMHSIDLKTGYVTLLETSGSPPDERSTPLIAHYNKKIFIWGGYNTTYPTELSILNLSTMAWAHKSSGINGRTSVPYVTNGSSLYCYGGSKTETLLVLDMESEVFTEYSTSGSPPPFDIAAAGMAYAEGYIFWFGGKSKSQFNLMFALELRSKWWFVFHVCPDGDTTTYADGQIDKLGLFLLPRIDSFGMQYCPKTRNLIGYLGNPLTNPPPFFVVSLTDALPVLKLREDMIDLLRV